MNLPVRILNNSRLFSIAKAFKKKIYSILRFGQRTRFQLKLIYKPSDAENQEKLSWGSSNHIDTFEVKKVKLRRAYTTAPVLPYNRPQ